MYIEIDYEGEKLLIETADDAERSQIEGNESEAGATWSDFKSWFERKKEKVVNYSTEKLTNLIRNFTKYLHESCSNLENIPKPNELIIEFSVGFAITGDVFIAKANANSGIKVSLKWNNPTKRNKE